MTWYFFAQTQQQVDIVGNIYVQWGSLGVLALLASLVVRYLLNLIRELKEENKTLRMENNDLKEKRLDDAKYFAQQLAKPAQDLMGFVGSLYELFTAESKRKD